MVETAARNRFGEAARALEAEGDRTRALIESLAEVDLARIVWDDWSVKDVLGHVESSHHALLDAARGTALPLEGAPALAEINEQRRQLRRGWSLGQIAAGIDQARAAMLTLLRQSTDGEWERPARTSSGRLMTLGRIAWLVSSHEREHRHEIERSLGRRLDVGHGHVASLNISNGGVPKWPIYSALLGELGLDGDAHRARMHGGPTAALCIFSLEVIERLQREGHPIVPGAIGENVTVAGIDWSAIGPGVRLQIGPTLVEVTRFTVPCLNIRGAFVGEDFSRVLATKHPGDSRVYARVLRTGEIHVGDEVVAVDV